MNNVILSRRSTRSYEDRPIEKDKIEMILRGAMQSPTSMNKQEWEFLVVKKAENKKFLSEVSPYAGCAAKADTVIVPMVNFSLIDKEDRFWIEDLSAVSATILYMAESVGLGAVWLGMYPQIERCYAIQKHFQLPEHLLPFSVIPMGYKAFCKEAPSRYDVGKVHWDI